MSSRFVVAGLLFTLLAISGPSADDRPQPGAVEQLGGPVSQDAKPPPLELTNAQRELVRKELLLKHNEVEFQLTETKAAKDLSRKSARVCRKALFRTVFLIQSFNNCPSYVITPI
jgi:hypothetical protein